MYQRYIVLIFEINIKLVTKIAVMGQLWTEKYRPTALSDIKGQAVIIDRMKSMVESKNISNLLFAGPAGVGKTTTILAIAHEIYGETWKENVMETNASMDRGIDHIREGIKNFARTKSVARVPFKLCILDEADALTKEAQQALRRTMEVYSDNCRFCLLANYSSKIIEPIQSRCTVFRFKPLEEKAMKKIIEELAKKEQLKISDSAISALYNISEGDVRRAINVLQSCAVLKKDIDESLIYELVSAARPKEIREVINKAITGNFIQAREQLLDLMLKYGFSGFDAIRQIQKEIFQLDLAGEKKAQLIERCGEIEFRMVEGSDEYLQLEALLASFSLVK